MHSVSSFHTWESIKLRRPSAHHSTWRTDFLFFIFPCIQNQVLYVLVCKSPPPIIIIAFVSYSLKNN